MINLSKENRTFGGIECLINAEFALFFGFIVLYLKSSGYSESVIGIMTSATLILHIVSMPVVGYISENYVSIKKILIFCMLTMLLCASLIPFIAQNYFIFFLLYSVIACTGRSVPAIVDIFITRLAKRRSGLDYAFVRGIGSAGYALTALSAGKIAAVFGLDILFVMHGFAIVLGLCCVLGAEDVPIAEHLPEEKREGFFFVLKRLMRNNRFVTVALASAIVYAGASAHGTYLSLTLTNLGGTSTDFGLAIFLQALSESPVLWSYRHLLRRFSLNRLLLFAFGVYIFRMVIMLLTRNIHIMLLVHLLQSLSFAVFLPSFIRYVQMIVPENIAATATLLGTSIYAGIGGFCGSLAGGFLLEKAGYEGLYTFCVACCVAGTVLFGVDQLFHRPDTKTETEAGADNRMRLNAAE